MKPIHVAATIVRLFSICLALYSCILILNSWMFYVGSEMAVFSFFSLVVPLAFFIISIVLWNFPVSISRKITGIPQKLDEEDLSFKGDEFLSICLFSLGLYFLYDVIGDTVYWMSYINNYEYDGVQEAIRIELKVALWSLAAKSLFTFGLIFGNRQIVKLFNKLRYGG